MAEKKSFVMFWLLLQLVIAAALVAQRNIQDIRPAPKCRSPPL